MFGFAHVRNLTACAAESRSDSWDNHSSETRRRAPEGNYPQRAPSSVISSLRQAGWYRMPRPNSFRQISACVQAEASWIWCRPPVWVKLRRYLRVLVSPRDNRYDR